MNQSIHKIWSHYLATLKSAEAGALTMPSAWHFCDNKQEANKCAELVLAGKKCATAPSVWELKQAGENIPEVGDLNIVTNWDGIAQCIIQTTQVEIVPFNQVSPEHARLEGEGDGSLQYWQEVHWNYYERVLQDSNYELSEEMPIVCEQFKVVFSE